MSSLDPRSSAFICGGSKAGCSDFAFAGRIAYPFSSFDAPANCGSIGFCDQARELGWAGVALFDSSAARPANAIRRSGETGARIGVARRRERVVSMGPTNVALVRFYQADQSVREAEARLDAATKDVRVQERRVNDLAERQRLGQVKLRETQSQAGQLDLDIKSRDAHIEKLRTQQQAAHNNKEYQAFLVEINTQKVDRGKVEDQTLRVLGDVDKLSKEQVDLTAQLEAERTKLASMKQAIGDRIAHLQADIDRLKPERDQAAAAVPAKAMDSYQKLAERFDGEAMSAVSKPDRRREEYVCTACNMDLVLDVYNRLHNRDDLLFCPSCRRILYIPDDLPPEVAVKTKATPKEKRPPREKKSGAAKTQAAGASDSSSDTSAAASEPESADAQLNRVLLKAAGESAANAIAAGSEPGDFDVLIDGRQIGAYKGQSAENLERTARFCLNEAGIPGTVQVIERSTADSQSA
jgi:hypothetical protein